MPNPAFGTCTDDVARALAVDLAHAEVLGWGTVAESAWRSMRYLDEAFDPVAGRFRNFRDAEGAWDPAPPSEDSQGRALLALGTAAATRLDPSLRDRARALFAAGLARGRDLGALRAVASATLGCVAAIDGLQREDPLLGEAEAALGHLAGPLLVASEAASGDATWRWPEPVLTYENGLLPQAMIAAGRQLGIPELRRAGLRILDWLIEAQTAADGTFSPIGNRGWWKRAGPRSRFDQQPIEAASTILACHVAWSATLDPRYRAAAERAYAWFLGYNDSGVRVAVPRKGACHDGLEASGVNANQGAESTLMWLIALERMRAFRQGPAAAPRDRTWSRPALLAAAR